MSVMLKPYYRKADRYFSFRSHKLPPSFSRQSGISR
jgi:hypothetical protein